MRSPYDGSPMAPCNHCGGYCDCKELCDSIAAKRGPRPLKVIAEEIVSDWGGKIYFGANPYLEAMLTLNSIRDVYGCEPAESVVVYFLANAESWRGDTARRVKAELKKMLKENT